MSVIIAFRRPDRIVLGCDSLGQRGYSNSKQIDRVTGRSKIRIFGRWAVSLVGFSQGPGIPSVLDLLGEAIEPMTNVRHAALVTERMFKAKVWPSLLTARSYPNFNHLVESVGGVFLAVTIAGREDDGTLALGMFAAEYVPPPLGQSLPGAKFFTGMVPAPGLDPNQPYSVAIGQDLASRMVMKRPMPDWLEQGDVDAAERLLTMQLEATPEEVGPPLHILEITRDGHQWHRGGF